MSVRTTRRRGWMTPAFVAAFATALVLPARGASRPLVTSDLRRIVDLEQPAIAGTGDRIAFVVVRTDFGRNAYVRELHVVDVRTGRDSLLVRGGEVTVPRWSPDGTQLAYLQERNERMALVSWNGGRPKLLARAQGDITDFAWRPDGGAIAFSAYEAASTRDYFQAGDNDYTQTALTPAVHLWLVGAAGGSARRLTRGTWTLTPTDSGGIFTPAFSWSGDGRRIAFARLPNTFSGDNEYSTLRILDVATGALSKPTAHPSVELAPQFSPDGRQLLYWYAQDGNFLAQNSVRVISGGADRAATADFDRDIGGTLWMPRSNALLACGNDATHSRAYLVSIGGRPRTLDLGDLEITCDAYQSSTFDAGIAASVSRAGSVAFLATDARHLRELYYAKTLSSPIRRLTHFNDFVERLSLGRIATIAWNGPGGFREYGVLTYPPNMSAGRKYPVVIDIHGGPGLSEIESLGGASYGGDWPIAQLIAARGYIVFAPNYRGSDDAGNAFLLAIVGDTVAGPSSDIMTGLAAVKALPQADDTRVAVCGWSYGGLLTSWLIGHDPRWKAAVSGAAVNVESQSYDLSVSNVQDRYYQGGVSPYVD
ncbi:MAG: S9 family peptidase, partial [Candidatus Eremiobacteraeota bacterium]|nr:S9 family peptidase [Candidatus Eremiobacteraeota bacterium]